MNINEIVKETVKITKDYPELSVNQAINIAICCMEKKEEIGKRTKAINQLESIKDLCKSMINKDDLEDIWTEDVEALDFAINQIKKSLQLPS